MKYTFPLKKTVGWTALGLPQRLCSGIQAIGDVLSICQRLVCREWRRSPDSTVLHWEVSRPTLDYHLSWGGSGQLSPRSPSDDEQRVKVQFEELNVECENLQVQCPKSDVGSDNLKDKCWMRKNECKFHWTWRSNSKTWLLLIKSWMLNTKKLNLECKLKWQAQNVGLIL